MIRDLIQVAINRRSSDRLVAIAQKGLHDPDSLSKQQIKSLAASVLSQARK